MFIFCFDGNSHWAVCENVHPNRSYSQSCVSHFLHVGYQQFCRWCITPVITEILDIPPPPPSSDAIKNTTLTQHGYEDHKVGWDEARILEI
jgi:hypothetical protein